MNKKTKLALPFEFPIVESSMKTLSIGMSLALLTVMTKNKILHLILSVLMLTTAFRSFADENLSTPPKMDTGAAPQEQPRVELSEAQMAQLQSNLVQAFGARGYGDDPDIPDPGTGLIDYLRTVTHVSGVKSIRDDLVLRWGLLIFNQPVQLLCDLPYTQYSGSDVADNGKKVSGYEGVQCGVKWQFYNNGDKGLTMSVAQYATTPHLAPKPYNRASDQNSSMQTGFYIMQTIDSSFTKFGGDGKFALVGNYVINRELLKDAPHQSLITLAAGMRVTDNTSVTLEGAKTPDGQKWIDAQITHQEKIGSKQVLFYGTAAISIGQRRSDRKGVWGLAGLEIPLDGNETTKKVSTIFSQEKAKQLGQQTP